MCKSKKNCSESPKEGNRIAGNILFLGLLQLANYFFPLLTIPYLVRVIGPEYFGLLAFATAVVAYFGLLTDYGFNLSATHQISVNRDNKDKIEEIFSSVVIIKVALMFASFLLLLTLIMFVEKFKNNADVYIVTFGIVVGQVLFPVWLFQGLEKMKEITYLNLISKILFVLLTFLFVNSEKDYLLVPIFLTLGSIITGLYSMYFIKVKLKYKFSIQRFDEIKFQLKEGWHIFISSVAISMYTSSATVILGLLTNNFVVGQFSAADKLIQAVKGLYNPVAQAIYPVIGKKFHEDSQSALIYIKKIGTISSVVMFAISIVMYIFSEAIVNLTLGANFMGAVKLIEIMAPLPFIVALSNIFGIQIMLNLNLKQAFSKILTIAAVAGVCCFFILVPIQQEIGAAITILVIETFITLSMFICIKNYFKPSKII